MVKMREEDGKLCGKTGVMWQSEGGTVGRKEDEDVNRRMRAW